MNLNTSKLPDKELRITFFVCLLRMLIKEPCWRDYSLLWKLWRSLNVIIHSTSCFMFTKKKMGGYRFGAVFHVQLCAWARGYNSVLHAKVCSVRCWLWQYESYIHRLTSSRCQIVDETDAVAICIVVIIFLLLYWMMISAATTTTDIREFKIFLTQPGLKQHTTWCVNGLCIRAISELHRHKN